MARHDIIVVGASAGGVEALQKLFRDLPADLPAAVFVVLHMPSYLTTMLPGIIGRAGPLEATEGVDGQPIQEGKVYVARPGCHLLVEPSRVRVSEGPKENGHRPSIDVLFRSAARAYGPRVVGVVLSGLLDDGAAGAIAVKRRGGLLVVQTPEDASFPDMPRAALHAAGTADYSVPLVELATLLVMLSRTSASEDERFPVPLEMQVEDDIAAGAESDAQVTSLLGDPSSFSCPECGGVLWDLSEADVQRFRCQVGHAYSAIHLFHAQQAALQGHLGAAERALREHALLARQVQQASAQHGWPALAERFLETSVQADESASLLISLQRTLARTESGGPAEGLSPRVAATTGETDET